MQFEAYFFILIFFSYMPFKCPEKPFKTPFIGVDLKASFTLSNFLSHILLKSLIYLISLHFWK